MSIGGTSHIARNAKDIIWIIWKKTQIFTRKHLSHVFAVLLSFGIIIREKSDILETLRSAHLSWLRAFIVYSILMCVGAIVWRFRTYTLQIHERSARVVHWVALLLLALGVCAFLSAVRSGVGLPSFRVTVLVMSTILLSMLLIAGCFWELCRAEPQDEVHAEASKHSPVQVVRRWVRQAFDGSRNPVRRAKTISLVFVAAGIMSLVLGRYEIKEMLDEAHVRPFRGLILMLTLLTLAAAAWDFWGEKLTTSMQEVRFLGAMRLLLNQLEKFTFGEDREKDVGKRLDAFMADFLEVTCTTLCGKKRVDGGFMQLKGDNDRELTLVASSRSAFYDKGLHVPLPQGDQETGPAGVAYANLNIVYMPFKLWKLGWPFKLFRNGKERYEPSTPTYGWIASPPENEQFRSVLCMPVAIYVDKDKKEPLGVLNYSTLALDPFVDRDFMMGECFGSILAQAFAVARREATSPRDPLA